MAAKRKNNSTHRPLQQNSPTTQLPSTAGPSSACPPPSRGIMREQSDNSNNRATFRVRSAKLLGQQCFDKLTGTGWINEPVILGTLITKRAEKNRYFYEFSLNGKIFEGFSFRAKEGSSQIFKEFKTGKSYSVEGSVRADILNKKFSPATNSTFKYKVYIGKLVTQTIICLPKTSARVNKIRTFEDVDMLVRNNQTFTSAVIRNVELVSGVLRRYLGCSVCSTKLQKANKHGKYACKTCTKTKAEGCKDRTRQTCLIIYDLELKDNLGNILHGGVLFHKQCASLFEKDKMTLICESESDLDAIETFKSMCGKTFVSCIVKNANAKKKNAQQFKLSIEIKKVTKRASNDTQNGDDTDNLNDNEQITNERPTGQYCLCEMDDYDDPEMTQSDAVSPPLLAFNDSGNESFEVKVPPSRMYPLVPTREGYLGLALVINMSFNQSPANKQRRGSENDIKELERVLPILKIKIFQGKTQSDPCRADFEDMVLKFKEELVTGGYSSSFVILMSHGVLYHVHLADETTINVYKDVIEKFGERTFPEFVGKPKIFIFHACQHFSDIKAEARMNSEENQVISDVVECFPCRPGVKAIRNSKNGSVFIQNMLNVFETFHDTMDLVEMLHEVQTRVSSVRATTGRINVPVIKPMLFQYSFYFRARETTVDTEMDMDTSD